MFHLLSALMVANLTIINVNTSNVDLYGTNAIVQTSNISIDNDSFIFTANSDSESARVAYINSTQDGYYYYFPQLSFASWFDNENLKNERYAVITYAGIINHLNDNSIKLFPMVYYGGYSYLFNNDLFVINGNYSMSINIAQYYTFPYLQSVAKQFNCSVFDLNFTLAYCTQYSNQTGIFLSPLIIDISYYAVQNLNQAFTTNNLSSSYNNGYNDGYGSGYNDGYTYGMSLIDKDYTIVDYLTSILSAPINMIKNLFAGSNFVEFFGFSLGSTLLSVLVVLIVFKVYKMFKK